MTNDKRQYISQDKIDELKRELKELKEIKIPETAKRIDEAKQMGDLSENAEYHLAREDMAWTHSRVLKIQHILGNSEIISTSQTKSDFVTVGSTIVVKFNDIEKEFTICGPQEADPIKGMISNESPLGQAFLGRKAGELIEIKVPAGIQIYEILAIK
ncbi:MAG: transcription elongation factor GreA [Patescibacteria group bacterium]